MDADLATPIETLDEVFCDRIHHDREDDRNVVDHLDEGSRRDGALDRDDHFPFATGAEECLGVKDAVLYLLVGHGQAPRLLH